MNLYQYDISEFFHLLMNKKYYKSNLTNPLTINVITWHSLHCNPYNYVKEKNYLCTNNLMHWWNTMPDLYQLKSESSGGHANDF